MVNYVNLKEGRGRPNGIRDLGGGIFNLGCGFWGKV